MHQLRHTQTHMQRPARTVCKCTMRRDFGAAAALVGVLGRPLLLLLLLLPLLLSRLVSLPAGGADAALAAAAAAAGGTAADAVWSPVSVS